MRYRVVAPEREAEFLGKGYKRRHFFPHMLHYLPKPGPGALRLSGPMCGITDPDAQWEILLHATPVQLVEFPRQLFFDDDIIWHKRQYGMDGHVAFAFVVVDGHTMFGLNYVSDVVQRISRRRAFKTRIETIFHGWTHMLLNGLLNFADEMHVGTFFSPTADLVMEHSRPAQPALFQRVYDHVPGTLFRMRRQDRWWVIDVEENRDRLVRPQIAATTARRGTTLCLVYDMGFDPSSRSPRAAPLDTIAFVEETVRAAQGLALPATYIASPVLFEEVRRHIAGDGHGLGFGQEDTPIRPELGRELVRCRGVDQRTKGYRLLHGRAPDPHEALKLCHHKFDWVLVDGTSTGSEGRMPVLEHGIVKIPVSIDDRALVGSSFDAWASRLSGLVDTGPVAVLSLGRNWSRLDRDRRRRLLERLSAQAQAKTCDQLAEALILSRAV